MCTTLGLDVVAMTLMKKSPPAHDTTTRVAGLRRYRGLAFLTVLLVLFGVFEVVVSGEYPVRLVRADVHCGRTASGDVSRQLQCLVADYVGQDPSVRNIELAVAKGDGSYSWAGSAGVAHQQGGAPMANDTPIYIASVTKIYIATTIMALAEHKVLALDDPIAKYLPADLLHGIDIYHGHDYSRQVTIRELVSMTSGIPDYYEERGRDGKTMFQVFIDNPRRSWTVDEMINRARTQLSAHFPPGTGVYYSDTGYQLLGKIIQNATHRPLAAVLADYIFRSLGLHHTWLVGTPKPAGAGTATPADVYYHTQNITATRSKDYWADGGIITTAADMITFLRALDEGKLISRPSLHAMHTWRAWNGPSAPVPGVQYGYGLWHFNLPGPLGALKNVVPTWGVSGSTGSFLYYSQPLNLYIAGTVDSASSDMTAYFLMGGAMSLVSGNEHSS
jgi:D-alanyl-D-alanine carboxypeptidase